MAELAPELRELLLSRFSSMEQVDVFVLLFRAADRQWSPAEVAAALDMPPQSAAMRLFLLGSAGLLASSGTPDIRYWYAPSPGLDELARAISDTYEQDRESLAAVIARASSESPARHFADAFRLRKP